MLYQSAMDLTNVDPMYQFSLSWFVDLFVMAISESKTGKATDKVCSSCFLSRSCLCGPFLKSVN